MEKFRSSPLSIVFPWLSPLVIKFALVNGGIEVLLCRNNQSLKNWQPSMLRHVLPEPLTRWIEDYHIHIGPQPYPLIKQLWQYLLPWASKKLIIDSSVLAELEEVSQPQGFALIWAINYSSMYIEGRFEGADRYLGMGWFHKGTKIWSLNNHPSNATDLQLKNLIVPVEQADFLMKSMIPNLQYYLPTRADFQLITNFAVRVIVAETRCGELTLALECNYPQFLPAIQIPLQKVDVLLTRQAIIRFPHQALTPALMQLLQRGSVTIQGTGVPLFINEQLPVLRRYYQINDDMAVKITQSNPIVSIALLKPTFTLIHRYENGVGKYITTATYQYQEHTLDMNALLTARGQNQRFVQQYAIWFEWPHNSYDLMNTIQQQRVPQVLRAEEVMGFDTRRVALLQDQPTAQAIQPDGTTPVERLQSVFAQLRHHGIPGGIVGEPTGTASMFINACEHLLRDNRQARILWLAPSNKKGSVTRAVNDSAINSYVTVASLVTLRDEPALISRSWTLVIFQCLDQLLDGSAQSWALFQMKWQWMLTSVTSKRALSPAIMRVLHLPDQYYEQFCARYLFDIESSCNRAVIGQRTSGLNTTQSAPQIVPQKDGFVHPTVSPSSSSGLETKKASYSAILPQPASIIQAPRISVQFNPETKEKTEQPLVQTGLNTLAKSAQLPIRRSIDLNQMKITGLHEESEQLQDRLTVEEEQPQFTSGPNSVTATPADFMSQPDSHAHIEMDGGDRVAGVTAQVGIPIKTVPDSVKSTPSPKIRPAVQLNQEIISKLRVESEQLQERLIVEAEEAQEQPPITFMPDPTPAAPVVRETARTALEVDEDWQIILQHWRPEHWEIISLLCQKQSIQLTTTERKDHRPVSRLIDEINSPVDEQFGDLLIDPDTQTISHHLQSVAESLVRWYQSSNLKGR